MLETIQVNTPDHTAMVDVTGLVSRKVHESGIRNGFCNIYVQHTTAGLTINEGADPAVSDDILNALDRMVPIQGPYRHLEGNSSAHIKTALIGTSLQVIIENGRLLLGTCQHVFLCEFDGPRTRTSVSSSSRTKGNPNELRAKLASMEAIRFEGHR